ncbi:glycosyltransferase [Pedobacter sp. PWIIR3]
MLENKTIFIFGATKFDGVFESTSYTTAKFFAKNNDVYYIDFPYTIKDYFSKIEKYSIDKRRDFFFNGGKNLIKTDILRLHIVILPLLLSINFLPENKAYRWLLKINESLIASRLNAVIRRQDLKDIIFINSFNFHYPSVGISLKPILSVYHCVDALIVDYDMKHGFISERLLVELSDLVVCTSKQLFLEKKKYKAKTFFIPNAADLTLSSEALNDSLEVHSLLKDIPKPIIGYFGHVERRMDFELLKQVCESNPQKSFVFVGPVSDEFVPDDFRRLSNVFFVGRTSYPEMPSVVKGFDVAIIPFKKDKVSSTIFPLKLFEYLGAGKPVVATDFNPDLKDFTHDTVTYCQDSISFSSAIDFYLQHDTTLLKSKRIQVAEENTWDRRLGELSSLLSRELVVKFNIPT